MPSVFLIDSDLVFGCFVTAIFLGTGLSARAEIVDVGKYRTPVSPGSLEEDVRFLRSLIPKLLHDSVPLQGPAASFPMERIDVRITRRKVLDRDGKVQRDANGRAVFARDIVLDIQGENFKRAALEFLTWRKEFESAWIRSASAQGVEPPPTPLQLIFGNTRIPKHERIKRMVRFYRIQSMPKAPPPTPNPRHWPISEVIRIPGTSIDVQFNLRAGRVTVLDASSSMVWVLPYPPLLDPEIWMKYFKGWVDEHGIEKATELAREEALKH